MGALFNYCVKNCQRFSVRKLVFCAILHTTVIIAAAPASARAEPLTSLTVLSDASLSAPLSQLARDYARDHRIAVNVVYGSSQDHAKMIEEGGEADLFITATPRLIERLAQQGLLDVYSDKPIAATRLVLVGFQRQSGVLSLEGTFPLFTLLRGMSGEERLILGDPETLAQGSYGYQSLRRLKLLNELENRLLVLQTLGDMKRRLHQGEAFAVLFASDIRPDLGEKTLQLFPADSHKPILFRAVVVAGSQMAESRRFQTYITRKKRAHTWSAAGFDAPPLPAESAE